MIVFALCLPSRPTVTFLFKPSCNMASHAVASVNKLDRFLPSPLLSTTQFSSRALQDAVGGRSLFPKTHLSSQEALNDVSHTPDPSTLSVNRDLDGIWPFVRQILFGPYDGIVVVEDEEDHHKTCVPLQLHSSFLISTHVYSRSARSKPTNYKSKSWAYQQLPYSKLSIPFQPPLSLASRHRPLRSRHTTNSSHKQSTFLSFPFLSRLSNYHRPLSSSQLAVKSLLMSKTIYAHPFETTRARRNPQAPNVGKDVCNRYSSNVLTRVGLVSGSSSPWPGLI